MRTLLGLGLLTLATSLLTSCQTTSDRPIVNRPSGSAPKVPIAEVRDAFSAAKAQDVDLQLGFFRAPWFYDYSSESSQVTNESKLLAALKDEVANGTWDASGRRAYREDNWLVVFHDAETLAKVRPWLQEYGQRAAQTVKMTAVELRIASVPALVMLEVLGIPRDSSVAVSESQMAALESHPDVITTNAPRVTVMDGQKAHVQIAKQRAYVSDWEVYSVDGEQIADPVIEVLHEGLTIDLRATRAGEAASIDLEAVTSQLIEMRTSEFRLTPEQTVEFEVPLVDTRRIESRLETVPNQWCFVRFGQTDQILLLRWQKAR